jgi:hypothetical protein
MDTSSSSINPTLELRLQEAAKILKTSKAELLSFLNAQLGFVVDDEGLQLLDAETTTEKIIADILGSTYPKLAALAAGAILKGRDPFKKSDNPIINTVTITSNEATQRSDEFSGSIISNQFVELTKALRDPKQLKDKELLEMYDRDRDYEIEQELHRRANYSHFVVLRPGGLLFNTSDSMGQRPIDIDMSLELLKRSRRMTNPTIVRQGDVFVNVYRITELNPEDQIIELCPFCGEATYKGYCESCGSDLNGMTGEVKAFLKLIADSDNFDKKVMSDRKAVLVSAGKGLEDLRKTWPRIAKQFDGLKMINGLPSLVIRKSLPTSKPADPFHVKN